MADTDLLTEIEAFLSSADVSLTEITFGRRALNDGHFVSDLREGRRVWPETAKKIRAFIAAYKPEQTRAA